MEVGQAPPEFNVEDAECTAAPVVGVAWTAGTLALILAIMAEFLRPSAFHLAHCAEGWQPWQPPKLEAPDWCDRVSSQHNNDKWARLPNHPCAFLRNATAAAAAVAAEAAGDAAQHAFGASADTNMAKFVGGG